MKRLTLCKSNEALLFGVFGGLADYFKADPTIVRLIGALLMFTGVGVLPYLIAAIIIPLHPSDK